MPPEINYEKCTGCGNCRDICAEDVFFGWSAGQGNADSKPRITYPEACFHCYLCADGCPAGAISIRTPLVMHVPYK